MKIVLATSNPHKVEEINAISKDLGVEFILPPKSFSPEENGVTFEENALQKAIAAYSLVKMPVLADDSGLCVEALDGAPGIFSARYADTAQNRIARLLLELGGVPDEQRGAKFVCAIAFLDENGKVLFLDRGECLGQIGHSIKGENGFGYDPIFIVDGYEKTMAELLDDEKNKISHRAVALNKFFDFLQIVNKS